jgi:hypothetical protein
MTPTTTPQNFDDSTLHGGLARSDSLQVDSPFTPRASLFDACHVGVVLRVVLLVQAFAGVGAMFVTSDPLAWLIAVCVFKGRLNRLQVPGQWLAGTCLGAVAGIYAGGLLSLMGMLPMAPWWASGVAGTLLSAMVLAGMFWRAKARTPAATAARLPPLLLQPLVENAVRHGVEPSASGAQLIISTRSRSGAVVIKVTNSVPGGGSQPGHGLALANVRERLFLLHDVQAQFKTAFKDGLFQVRLEVPL